MKLKCLCSLMLFWLYLCIQSNLYMGFDLSYVAKNKRIVS